jgi:hypothetical protein
MCSVATALHRPVVLEPQVCKHRRASTHGVDEMAAHCLVHELMRKRARQPPQPEG